MDTVPIARPRDTDPPPLLGRDRELAAFDDTLTDTFSDRGRTVLLSGEAGIGKSTLVAHVRHDAERKGAIVLTGHCYDLTATPPYGPWIGVIQSYDRLRSVTDAELPEIPPELMPGTPLVTIQMQGQLFDSVYSFLDRVAHARPLVIILEDLHWADPASIEMLRDLARRLNGAERARLLLIATFRENELDIEQPLYQHRPALVRESNALRINLQRLDSAALDGIVRSRYVLSDDDRQRLGVWLDRQSEGNPFFTLELLRSLEATGVLAMLLAETGQAQRALDIVTHGLEHLPDDHLADRRFSGRLHRAGGLALGLIGEIARAKESHLLSCRIFDSAGLHLETFQSILARLETVIDVYHLDDVDQRARLLLQAREYGELAEAAFPSNLTYQHLLLRDLLLDGVWDDVASLVAIEGIESGQFLIVHDIHAAAGWLAWRRGDTTEAWRRVRALIPRGPATEPGDAVFLAALDLQRVAIGLSLDGGQLKDARSWLASLERWVAWSGTVVGRAEARIEAARIHLASGDLHTARELASEALALAESPGRQLPLIEARRVAGVIAVAMLRFGEAREHLTASATLAARCNVPFERALTALELARLSLATGDVLSARSHLETAREIANRLGARPQLEHVSRIEDEITDASGRSAYPAGLSQREVEVLRLVASGMTDAETAEALSISPRTVGQHLRSIYNKLGVSSRVAASRFAVENGLV